MKKDVLIINGLNCPIPKNLLKSNLKKLNIHKDNLYFLNDLTEITTFNNGEIRVKLIADRPGFSFQNCNKFIIVESLTGNPYIKRTVDDIFFEVESIINACRNLNKDAEIVLIATNFSYARQDRAINQVKIIDGMEYETSESSTLDLRIKNLKNCGLTKLVTFDPHSNAFDKYSQENNLKYKLIEKEDLLSIFGEIFRQAILLHNEDKSLNANIEVFFRLFCSHQTNEDIEFIKENNSEFALAVILEFIINKLVLVAPDHGCSEKVKILWSEIKNHLLTIFLIYGKQTSRFINLLSDYEGRIIFIKKYRPEPGKSEITEIVGPKIDGKICLVIDDILDTGGTLCNSAKALKENYGASDIYCFTTHGVLSSNAVERLHNSEFSKIYITDTETSARSKIEEFYLDNKAVNNKFYIYPIEGFVTKEILDEISN